MSLKHEQLRCTCEAVLAEEIVAWLCQRGDVSNYLGLTLSDEVMTQVLRRAGVGDIAVSPQHADYNGIFRSRVGLQALFTITADRKLLVSRIDPLQQ